MNENDGSFTSIDLVYTEIINRLDKQLDTIEVIDTKIGILIGFVGAISALAFTRTSLFTICSPREIASGIFSILAGIGLLASLILAIVAYSPKNYRRDPSPRGLRENYLCEDNEKTKLKLIDNWVESFEKNAETLHNKTELLKKSLIALLIGLTALGVSAFI